MAGLAAAAGHARREGSGDGSAWRTGRGLGDSSREGSGTGDAGRTGQGKGPPTDRAMATAAPLPTAMAVLHAQVLGLATRSARRTRRNTMTDATRFRQSHFQPGHEHERAGGRARVGVRR